MEELEYNITNIGAWVHFEFPSTPQAQTAIFNTIFVTFELSRTKCIFLSNPRLPISYRNYSECFILGKCFILGLKTRHSYL